MVRPEKVCFRPKADMPLECYGVGNPTRCASALPLIGFPLAPAYTRAGQWPVQGSRPEVPAGREGYQRLPCCARLAGPAPRRERRDDSGGRAAIMPEASDGQRRAS